jgi:DUF4097 and DUF4098 domain-containing protein YvlB
MTSVRRDRRIALITGGLIAIVAIVCSAIQVAGWTVRAVERSTHETIPGPVRELRIDAGKGDVALVPASGKDVTIDGRVKSALRKPRLRVEVDGSDVRVKSGCTDIVLWHCSARIVVGVPAGTAVRVKGHSGDITAAGLDGAVELRTHSGDVRADGLIGTVRLKTASGDVVARNLSGATELESASGDVLGSGLGGATVRAHTASGDVVLRFSSPPTNADASTASGDVFVSVPPGEESYRVDADTKSGDSHIGIRTDPAATRVLRARTHSGDTVVSYSD